MTRIIFLEKTNREVRVSFGVEANYNRKRKN